MDDDPKLPRFRNASEIGEINNRNNNNAFGTFDVDKRPNQMMSPQADQFSKRNQLNFNSNHLAPGAPSGSLTT